MSACASAPGPSRIAWEHDGSLSEVLAHRYTLTVDATEPYPIVVTCDAVTTALVTCAALLPGLSVGHHTLVVTAANHLGANAQTFDLDIVPLSRWERFTNRLRGRR